MGGRHIMIDWTCKNCGNTFQIKRCKVKEGKNYFCTKSCCNEWQKEEGKKTWGKENATIYLDKSRNIYYAHWIDLEGVQRQTTWAHWAWEMEHGEVPDGYRVAFIDGDQLHNSIDNLYLKSWDEYAKEISERTTGKVYTQETLDKMSLAKKGKPLPKEHAAKIALATKKKWDAPDSVFRTEEYFNKQSAVRLGDKNPAWIHGNTKKSHPPEFNNYLKRKVKIRDNYECQICGKDVKGLQEGNVHHIDADKHNNTMENLVLLCASCHTTVHNRRNAVGKILEYQQKLNYYGIIQEKSSKHS